MIHRVHSAGLPWNWEGMNKDPIVLALANPIPEIMPQDALEAGAAFAKDGRTVNNCLVFPGLVRGTLDARTSKITYPMKFAAAEAIAGFARKHEGVPNFMNLSIHKKIAEKVKQAALKQNNVPSLTTKVSESR